MPAIDATSPEPISGAGVVLFDESGNAVSFFEDVEFPGQYILPNFSGVPGSSYYIRVTLPNEESYESIPEKMPLVTGEDLIHYSMEPEQYTDQDGVVAERYFVKIFTTHTLAPTVDPLFIKWHVHEDYVLSPTDFPDPFNNVPPSCYISQPVDPQRIVLFNSDEVKTSVIPDLLIASRLLDPSFKERHYFTTYQSALTEEAFEYWRKVEIVANQTGSIFDAPPARVKGNFMNVQDPREEVHGYFQAVNQTFHRFYLLPADLPYRMPVHCEYRAERNMNDYPSECLNCLSVRNSSYKRPPWF